MHSLISKIFICIFSLVLIQLPLVAQQVDRAVYSSSGKHIQKNGLAISYTIGEPVTFTGTGTNVMLTQGFEQPDQAIITIIPSFDHLMDIIAFPNPVRDQLQVRVSSDQLISGLKFELFDLLGKKINLPYTSASTLLNTTWSFDLSFCKAGIYFITISSPGDMFNNTFKIIKE
jgi:hypothetical protein